MERNAPRPRRSPLLQQRSGGSPWLAGTLATLTTSVAMILLFDLSLLEVGSTAGAPATVADRVTFVATPAAPERRASVRRAPVVPVASPRRSSVAGRSDSVAPSTIAPPPNPSPTSPDAGAARGIHPNSDATAVGTLPLGPRLRSTLSPTAGLPPAPAADSVVRALGASTPALAGRRVPTREEQDDYWRTYAANQREARGSGRPAPVGDPSRAGAQMGGAAVSLPLFAPGPSRAKRLRDSLTWKENARLFEKLQARLDSLKRARQRDSAVAARTGRPDRSG